MKISLMIVGSLLVAFGECSALALDWNPLKWLPSGFNFGGDEWENIRQQCAEKGFSPIYRSGSNGKISIDQNGVKHYYEQSVDPNTGKVQGRYYSYNSNNRNAEPICGKLTCPHCI